MKEQPHNRKYAFLSGLPRSGSTLLSSIFNQNPNIHSSANSPMCSMMSNLETNLIKCEQFVAYPKPQIIQPMIMGILDSFYSDRTESVVIDKSREWSTPQNFELLKRTLPYEPKIIICVRPILEILASFINLVNKNTGMVSFIDKEIEAHQQVHFYNHPHETRCDSLMRPRGPIDNALYGVAFALQPENKHNFHFVEYSDIVTNPEQTISEIYAFLGIENFKHDYSNIENNFHENDEIYGLRGMHDIRKTLSPTAISIQETLPPRVITKYSNMEFWRQPK